jgi:hypothetical protein
MGAYDVHGAVDDKWAFLRWAKSWLELHDERPFGSHGLVEHPWCCVAPFPRAVANPPRDSALSGIPMSARYGNTADVRDRDVGGWLRTHRYSRAST